MEHCKSVIKMECDDRCIPPSETSSHKYNNKNEMLGTDNEHRSVNSVGTSGDKSVSTANASKDLTNSINSKNKVAVDDFILTVENLQRIKRGDVSLDVGPKTLELHAHDSTKPTSTKKERIASPPLKLEMKTESTLITDALNRNRQVSQSIDNLSGVRDKNIAKMEIRDKVNQAQSSSVKPVNSATNTPTKSEHNYHRTEKDTTGKARREYRYSNLLTRRLQNVT